MKTKLPLRAGWWLALPTLAVVLALSWPLIFGGETLYLRDVLNTHMPLKRVVADDLQAAQLGLLDPYRASGQPLLGNLNSLALYPSNLLFLVADFFWAFNAHFWLHWLLAVWLAYWLGRRLRFQPAAAWTLASVFALSGFFLSQLNLLNLVSGVALAPGFLAACVGRRGIGGKRQVVAWEVGILWALVILSGDPIIAAMILLAGLGMGALEGHTPKSAEVWLGLAAGTLLAAPQWVELLRVLPGSFRGGQGFDATAVLRDSWSPLWLLEQLVPLGFGRPDLLFWGSAMTHGYLPLFFSFHFGVVALALLLAARGGARRRLVVGCWLAIALALFLALGRWNPVVVQLAALPGSAALRSPVKAWLVVSLGASLLCAVGAEQLAADGGRRLRVVLAVLAGTGFLLLLALLLLRQPLSEAVADAAGGWPLELARRELGYSLRALVTVSAVAVIAWICASAGRDRPVLVLAALVALHAASQAWLLRPLVSTRPADAFRSPPAALAAVAAGDLVFQGRFTRFDRSRRLRPFPDADPYWNQLVSCAELYSFCGVPWGLRYLYNVSPERLDSRAVTLARGALPTLASDSDRLRLIRADGGSLVVLDRPLRGTLGELATLRLRRPTLTGEVLLYRLRRPLPEARLLPRWREVAPEDLLGVLLDPGFDPRREVALSGATTMPPAPPRGRAELRLVSRSRESWHFDTAGAGGVLLLNRAFLEIYRATVDGRPAATRVGNLSRLAVEVPAGSHQVRIWVSRRPLQLSAVLAVVGALLLLARALRWSNRGAAWREGHTS